MSLACPRHSLTLPLAKRAGANDPWCYDKIIAAWWACGNRMMFVNWPLCIPHSSLVHLRAHCHLFSLLLSLPLLFPVCYSRSELLQPSLPSTPRSPLPTASCWEAWSTANIPSIILALLQCVKEEIGKGGKEEKGNKETGRKGERRERRHICSTHPSAKRYNYLSQHIIHVLYQPKAPCFTPPHSPRVGPIF